MTTRTPAPTRLEVLSRLGFRWLRVGGSRVTHLVPGEGRIHDRSRTECGRLVGSEDLLETPAGLLAEIPKCQRCEGTP